MAMLHWMRALAAHYERALEREPDAKLLLVTDIDGTILDMRAMVLAVLKEYDRAHRTKFFERAVRADVTVHENEVEALLERLRVPIGARASVMAFYLHERWSARALYEMHRPFHGVLEVIRWFQLQPRTTVALVTGRPEALRADTLRSLNAIGAPYRVEFASELLFMNPGDWEERVTDVKAAGVAHFRAQGYRPFAFIDNEPANLKAVGAEAANEDVLLLHANTIFESKRVRVPRGSVRGKEYRLDELIAGHSALPSRVQLVWHGVNDEENLRQLLASPVRWAEVDARLEPGQADVIVRGDSFDETPLADGERWLTLAQVLDAIRGSGRAIKIDLKGGPELAERVLELVREGLPDDALWFNARIDDLGEEGFRRLRAAHPGAIVQCPAEFVAPLVRAAPESAHRVLEMLRGWGIDRFSLSWEQPALRDVVGQIDRWGYDVNIYRVPDLESFLSAVLLLPKSVTSDFNFPKWRYYGRGPGKHRTFHEYR